MIEIVGTIALVLGVLGALLINRKFKICFAVWAISNIISACIHGWLGVWSLVLKDIIYLALCIEGWIRWGRDD